MTPRTWTEELVFLDGHLHSEARDCLHRDGDACRVCCTHDEDPRLVEPEPEDSDWRADVEAGMRAVVWVMGAFGFAVVLIVLSVLTVAGVIPS